MHTLATPYRQLRMIWSIWRLKNRALCCTRIFWKRQYTFSFICCDNCSLSIIPLIRTAASFTIWQPKEVHNMQLLAFEKTNNGNGRCSIWTLTLIQCSIHWQLPHPYNPCISQKNEDTDTIVVCLLMIFVPLFILVGKLIMEKPHTTQLGMVGH